MDIDKQRLGQKALSQAKKKLLDNYLKGKSEVSFDSSIEKRPSDFAQLSPTQMRLWYLYEMDPNSPEYNYSTAVRLTGKLDLHVLQKCINEIIRRHEILRTSIIEINNQPNLLISPECNLPFQLHDLSQLPKPKQEEKLRQILLEDEKKPFNLSTGPVLRVSLLSLGRQKNKELFTLIFTIHHIFYDGWSAGVLLREFGTLYQSFVKGQASPLLELPIQYADFAYWQHNHLHGQRLEQQLAYWKKQLSGIPEFLELPSDHSRPSVRSYHGANYSFSFSAELTYQLKKVSRVNDCTLFTLLLTSFNILLYRYSGESDICVGIPVAGRTKPELENLIGFFVNTLIIRTKIDNNPQLVELTRSIQETVLDAQLNQDVPFDKLVEELKPQRNLEYNPFFQVMFVLHNVPLRLVDLEGLKLEKIELDYEISKFDLVLHATEKNGLELSFEYSTELFDSSRIESLANYFKLILKVFTDDLNTRVNDFPLLTQQESSEIFKWNATQRDFPQKQFLQHGFENKVKTQPQSIAVSCDHQTLSYLELDERANQLAHWLCLQGVGIEVHVGICLERSIEMIVGVLAILKAGGVYVPINSTNPSERISSLLTDCGAQILLTQEQLLAGLPLTDVLVFCLDRDWDQISKLPVNKIPLEYHNTAAYVIYTSGSTGAPKGVLVTHENGISSTWARFDYYQDALDGFLLLSPLAFDSSVAGIFWTLSLGGRLFIPTEEEIRDIDALTNLMAQKNLSHILCLPSYYGLILDSIEPKKLINLRTVIVAGEACLPGLVEKHNAKLPNVHLYNEYGPTEATVWSSVYSIQNVDSASGLSVAIGQPIANIQLYLFDSYLNQVPIGVPGELYIGGAGLARGYLGKPDLTAKRFVPNSISEVSGSRMYKTGDLARYRADGNIEFLGRTDDQVKIRGFRIELGEIESQLLRYPDVLDVVVIAREEGSNKKYLVAYWVAVPELEENLFEIELLRDFLKNSLPDHMVPSVFVQLEQLPRTTTGKIDRKCLPLPDWNEGSTNNKTQPRTPIEKQLANIWIELLEIEDIGIHDNFFSLGGDSILAIQMVNHAKKNGLYIKPQQLSRHQTIIELAEALAEWEPQSTENLSVKGDVPLTPIQHWFFEKQLLNFHHWNSALMLKAQVPVDSHQIKQAVDFLMKYHDALSLRFTQDTNRWHQRYAEGQNISVFHQVDLSSIDDEVLSFEIEKQASIWQQKLNITEGSLIQVILFNTGNNRPARLFLVAHHLVVDGVSWRIILDDLQTLFRQLEANQTLSLPPKTTSYQQWAYHLQELAQSASMQNEFTYWFNLFASKSPMPIDNANGKNIETMSVAVTNALGIKNTKKLLHHASTSAGSAINDILLAALAKTLSIWSKSPDILMDVNLHGRVDISGDLDLSRSVGWFTSVFPVLICLPDDLDKKNILSIVKNQLLKIPNKGIGYGLLRYLRGLPVLNEELHSQCRSDVSFNYLGQIDQAFSKSATFKMADESVGLCIAPQADRHYDFSIDAYILDGDLQISWTYSSDRYKKTTIQQLMSNYSQSIIVLMDEKYN
jgi:amino acid adenylation domain-containing protein/non-ribosomal peptide synthase protein (TIGR01720 family)